MSEEQIKKAYQLAEKELNEKKEEKIRVLVKKIVQESLERIEKLDNEIKELQEEKKVLKQTIDDLKEGKLDLLKERIEKEPEVLKVIPLRIEITEIRPVEIVNVPYVPMNPWRQPWTVWYGNGTTYNMSSVGTGSEISNAVNGTYCLTSGRTVTLR